MSPETRDYRSRLVRSALCIAAVGLVYEAGILNVPRVWMLGDHRSALLNLCYGQVALLFLIYCTSGAALRWTIIPIGAASGFLAAIVAQHAVAMVYEPQRWINLGTRQPLQMIVSNLMVSLVYGAWLGGAMAGGIALASCHVLGALKKRWPHLSQLPP